MKGLLEIQGLEAGYGASQVLFGADLRIRGGEVATLLGRNGMGKSTLVRALFGLIPVAAGAVSFDGAALNNLPTDRIARRGLARTFQATTLFKDATALENVLVGYRQLMSAGLLDAMLRSARLAREEGEAQAAAHQALVNADLDPVADRPANSLTQEQQKRLAIAVALVARPKLLLLDEPFAGINANQTRGLITFIESIAAGGVTILLIEHQMHAVMQLCRRIMVLDYGKKIAEGTPDEIRRDPAVLDAYLGGHA